MFPELDAKIWREIVAHNVALFLEAKRRYYEWSYEADSPEWRHAESNYLSIMDSLANAIHLYARAVIVDNNAYVPMANKDGRTFRIIECYAEPIPPAKVHARQLEMETRFGWMPSDY